MEKLKSVIPETLKLEISQSTIDELHCTCSSLLNFFQNLPLFHQMVRELTDPEKALCGKNKEAAMEAKAKGNECFSKGEYSTALHFYSQALRAAPADVEDKEKNLVAMLYLNRASTLHKLGFFLESLRDCSRALIVSPAYAKAWFRRAKANSSLGNYEDAIKDLTVSLKIETSSSGKKQIENELNMLLNKSGLSRAIEKPYHDSSVLQIILKNCRETHCAFCFNELPADTVPCVSCSIPLYCSLNCQVQAGGEDFSLCKDKYRLPQELSDDLEQYAKNVTSPDISSSSIEHAAEHKHECQGMHWPAVLPSDVVLAGRILVKHIEKQSCGGVDSKINRILDLCENYGKLSYETKLEFHVYSIILLCCLQRFYASKLPLNSATTLEIIMLLSRIRVNSMAIVRMNHPDGRQNLDYNATSSVEQVQVAQAVYSSGSLFNHSCVPNVHAYFLSRTLFMRATENVTAGSELELSYGPQVGQWDCSERRKFLEERYSFICQCSGCSQLNFSDLVHTGYRCSIPNCSGVVLESCVAKYEKEKLKHFKGPDSLQQYILKDDKIGGVASHVFEQNDYYRCFEPGHCLSCGSFRDLPASQKTIVKAEIRVRRLQEAVASGEIATDLVVDALKSIDILRTVLHPFNKRIAEVEDIIAQAFCSIGEFQAALKHCRASIEILEKLYGESHIVIGNELIKLASIQLSNGLKNGADNTSRTVAIFSQYYGSHADNMFPHLRYLKS
ncbi:PREDICTED: uncharacterized protein LOC105977542 isoform X3 [Erythranthe guttata]|uniref:uncharacterized protein LOC105977542 isoform X3 n=1 Tax=Erythranthe guttata TaxID=4155 RepID=UPI00064DFC22|nr:PREDICTED: uncharacterized protein LOC105977542 isoform X3 [Erythranthe guttata]|eukprot:XP_012858311.1 PREDICTED: uncharacterized protein LOC105977542 isoform X3 [Erythranthe guttata]